MSSSGRSLGQIAQTVGVTAGPVLATTAYATIPDMTITINSRGGTLRADLDGSFIANTVLAQINMAFSLDGAAETGIVNGHQPVLSANVLVSNAHVWTNVAAGAHTITGRWQTGTTSATVSAAGTLRRLIVQELPN